MDIRLVREVGKERNSAQKRPKPSLSRAHASAHLFGRKPRMLTSLGLKIYDWLAGVPKEQSSAKCCQPKKRCSRNPS